jgi:hypothetical protein
MKSISYEGISKVINLLNSGLKLEEIVDSYGRPIHEDAKLFFIYHKQAKRLLIKKASNDIIFRNYLEKFE